MNAGTKAIETASKLNLSLPTHRKVAIYATMAAIFLMYLKLYSSGVENVSYDTYCHYL